MTYDDVRIAIHYGMPIDDVVSIHNYYMSKGMSDTRATYYTQLAVSALTGNSII